MKQCPICQSWAFDDSETCYGCLHRFTGEEQSAMPAPSQPGSPGFVITIRPERDGTCSMSWQRSADLAPCSP